MMLIKPSSTLLYSIIRSLWCITLLTNVAGCHKEDGDTIVEGQVSNYLTGSGIPYARLAIYSTQTDFIWTLDRLDKEGQADASGNFKLSFNSEENRTYEIRAEAPHYTDWNHSGIRSVDKPGKKNKDNQLNLYPLGYVRWEIKSGMTNNRSITINRNGWDYDIVVFHPTDTTIETKALAEIEWAVTYYINPNVGSSYTVVDTVFISSFDTIQYFVTY